MWYIADLIEEITVEGEADNVIHINSILIEADDDEAAYAAATAEGYNDEYENPRGQLVQFRFLGLRDLIRIYDDLEHGAELMYEERVGVSQKDIASLVSARGDLAVFRNPEARNGPDYTSKEIVEEAERMVRRNRAGGDGSST